MSGFIKKHPNIDEEGVAKNNFKYEMVLVRRDGTFEKDEDMNLVFANDKMDINIKVRITFP